MNASNLKIATEGDSPRGWQRYALLHTPKAGLPFRSQLPLLILAFGAGALLGGTWDNVSPEAVPGGATFPKTEEITSSAKAADGETAKSSLRNWTANESYPIAWLMSFPNSGTSYTSKLVRTVTGKRTATNYGTETGVTYEEDGTNGAVFENSPGGPFWSDPHKEKPESGSRGFLLTKTHCGGRCNQCPPDEYVENHMVFSHRCLEGYHVAKDGSGEPKEVLGSYSKDIVARAVHLIRDPFDNVVSRFHLANKQHHERSAVHPQSKDGFRAFCKGLGERFYAREKASKFYSDVFEDVKNVPCHADFFKYIQWHNLAFTVTWDLGIPTLILHYENYTDNFDRTKDMLLGFLDQDGVHEPPPFVTGKTYRDYFTEKEIRAVSTMFSKLALDKTWHYTKHYFIQ